MFKDVRGMTYRNKGCLEAVLGRWRRIGYRADCRLLNAVRYGVPQNRARVIAAGHYG